MPMFALAVVVVGTAATAVPFVVTGPPEFELSEGALVELQAAKAHRSGTVISAFGDGILFLSDFDASVGCTV